jgi:uracil phosphoribosyltransferase
VQYYVRLPEIEGRTFVVCDPMLATGYSGAHAVQVLIDRGVMPENIRFLALVAAPEGVEVFAKQHPTIPVYVAALDSHLNEKAYIVPGLGDAGDRIFGTKH